MGSPAAAIVAAQPDVGPYVFPGKDLQKPFYDPFTSIWKRVRARAQFDTRVRLYDACRHTFDSWAHDHFGVPRERIKQLMGHADETTTGRYAHFRPETLLKEADRVSEALATALQGRVGDVLAFREPR